MKRKISLILVLVLLFTFMPLVFSGCGEKQVPIYLGMGMGNAGKGSTMDLGDTVSNVQLLSSTDTIDAGGRYGYYDGDYAGKNITVDQEKPFTDKDGYNNALEEALRRKASGILNNLGGNIYLPNPTPDPEDVFSVSEIPLNIFLYNPDNFEIVSFTLNGEEYSMDMFESGSSMEKIVIKPKVIKTASGGFLSRFQIGNIKYRDGDEIKDVIMEGSSTLGVSEGVGDAPVATVSDMSLVGSTLSFDVNISRSTASVLKGEMLAVVYDGNRIVASCDLTVGDNSVTFDGLSPNTVYQCAVGGYYYPISDDIPQFDILYKHAFYTDPVVLFDNVTVGEESISFDYLWSESQTEEQIISLTIYKDGVCYDAPDVTATAITGLCSGTTYKLVAEYMNGEKTESIYLEFTTCERTGATI